MRLTYYGHCAFLWTSVKGVTVLVDPFDNQEDRYWFLLPFPTVDADVAMVTHDHFDHDAVSRLRRRTQVVREPGSYSFDDVEIKGVSDIHAGRSGLAGMRNTLFVLETEGVRFCHIGDNRHDIPDDVRNQIGRVDVLMVTTDDSSHLLSFDQVSSLVETLNPSVVVPMHYYIPGLTTQSSGLKSVREWLSTQSNVKRLGSETIDVSSGTLPTEREVWVFDAALR